jgi:GTPase SAR1 family protein
MGVILSILRIFLNYLTRDDKIKICFLGPTGSGKTSLMFYNNCKDTVITIPTNGYNSDLYNYKKKEFLFWDIEGSQVRNWPGFVEAADFLFFVIDSSDINSILSGKELLYQIYFGKRFRMFLENLKEKEKETNNSYFFQEEEEDKISYNGDDYMNLIEDPSDYESVLISRKLDVDETGTDKTSNFDVN